MRLFMTTLAALALAGCTTPEQKAANMQAEMTRMMYVYGPACAKLGYPSNSDQWRNCVLQLSAKEDAQRYGNPNYYAGYGRSHWGLGGVWGPHW
ncbi:MAG: hypothetical protein V4631_21285 [Pseudomonadota bacterium]